MILLIVAAAVNAILLFNLIKRHLLAIHHLTTIANGVGRPEKTAVKALLDDWDHRWWPFWVPKK